MPELPEVETVKNTLKPQLIGQKITNINIHYEKMIKDITPETFTQNLLDQQFIDILRRGKYLIFELDDYYLLSHLRMEGKFFYNQKDAIRPQHTHVVLTLNSGDTLSYEDVRKFGTFHLYDKTTDLEQTASFRVLGPEPWDETFNVKTVKQQLENKKMPIKSMLLSQKVVTGLGNIYVDEVLFASNIHPLTPSGQLNTTDIEKIITHTREILQRAITFKGTTIKTFSSSHGSAGEFGQFLQVHTKKDEPCPSCCTTIEKIKVGGRGTYFCRVCQIPPST